MKPLIIFWAFFVAFFCILNAAVKTERQINSFIDTSAPFKIERQPDEMPAPEEQVGLASSLRVMTAFNAGDPAQTDANPCRSASGANICEILDRGFNVCAFNGVAFGTILLADGLGQCIVLDRTASKYAGRVDWAFKADEKDKAIQFGKQSRLITILKP